MVQHDTSSSSDENAGPKIVSNPAKGIPTGKYRLVGWAIDTTGRRLIDEIVQIAGYAPKSQFSQYIMPFADMNPSYSRKHNIRVVNTIRYRRLKDMTTNEFVKTKSEISALGDFLQWLEEIKGDSEGVILIFHEIRKLSPGLLLEALRRNNFLDRFNKVVKGFANGFNISKVKCRSSTKSFSLRVMAKLMLNKDDDDFSSAINRAKVTYDIAVHLAQSEREDLDSDAKGDYAGEEPHLIDLVCPYANPIPAEEEEIAGFKILLERQNTFRPVFGALMRASRPERQHASHLRRLLAENNVNYERLKEAYEAGAKDGIEKVIKNEVANAKEKELEELLEILDCFFDPDKKAVQPKTTRYLPNVRKPRRKSFNKSRNSNSESKSANESDPKSANESSSENQAESASSETTPRGVDEAKPETREAVPAQ